LFKYIIMQFYLFFAILLQDIEHDVIEQSINR